MNGIQSKNQRIGPYKTNKILFSWFDNKVYVYASGTDALGHG